MESASHLECILFASTSEELRAAPVLFAYLPPMPSHDLETLLFVEASDTHFVASP